MRFLLVTALLLAGCATQTHTQPALICDRSGKPLMHAEVNLYGEQPKVSLAPTMGTRYTKTFTDQHGLCVLTYPSKKSWLQTTDWTLFVYTKRQGFGIAGFTEKDGRLLVTVFPFGDPPGVVRLTATVMIR